ncbi:MAG: hypothetical protein COA79_01720 [Planctomycetota bacterium]|nr:MAG: hypothetical protein COA79_01720 [Planctomycetota bacterium]
MFFRIFISLIISAVFSISYSQEKWPAKVVKSGLPSAYSDSLSLHKSTWPPAGKSQKFKFSKDDIYSLVGSEKYTNSGKTKRIKLKGRQEFFVFDADISALKGKIITGALLHVNNASPKDPFYRVGVSSMSSVWKEGSAEKGYQKINGEACFSQVELGKRDWSFAGSTVLDVIFGLGHTTWKFADCTQPDDNGWQTVAVDPKVIAAKVAGISFGFAVNDEVGSEWTDQDNKFKFRHYPNRFCYSRHNKKNKAPYLEIWTSEKDSKGPNAVKYIKVITKGFKPGEALVKWITPSDVGKAGVIGYDVTYLDANGKSKHFPRYLIPMAGVVGGVCKMHIQDLAFSANQKLSITIVPIDATGNKGESFTHKIQLSGAPNIVEIVSSIKPFPPSTDLPSVGGIKIGVIDVLDKVDPIKGNVSPKHPKGYRGGNHLFSAAKKKIRLFGARNEFVWFQLVLEGQGENIQITTDFSGEIKADLYEPAYVGSKIGAVPDPLFPVGSSINIPVKIGKVKVKGQKFHTVVCEVFIPHKANAGKSSHSIKISVGGKSLTIPIDLTVWDFTLPDKLSFISEMNSYRFNIKNNYELHRLAHKYRLVLNQLPYGWKGSTAWRMSFNGDDFEGWDWFHKNIGPLLDGSAFKGLPRGEMPVPALYTGFNENWPINIVGEYKSDYWIDSALSKSYVSKNKKAYAAFAKHMDKKGYHETFFEFYLNNKIYYRNKNTKSVCPWILDEPNRTQDFWALRYYGIMFHQAVDPVKGKAKMIYRTDISYPEHGRETMWGVCDRVIIGGANPQKIRQKKDELNQWHSNYYGNYGSTNEVHEPNTQPAAWSLLSWSQGATGILPWQTIAKEKDWIKGSKTGLFYPHESGVKMSIRLKSYTRGQQDIEYLTWYKMVYKADHFAVANALNKAVSLKATIHKTSETDAGKIKFAQADPQSLWQFRVAVGQAISNKKPAFKKALVDWKVPPSDMNNLPDIGYTNVAPYVKPHGPKMNSFKQR